MSRGDGLDYIFTLSNASQEDAGIYEVAVEGTHPATGSLIIIRRDFILILLVGLKIQFRVHNPCELDLNWYHWHQCTKFIQLE